MKRSILIFSMLFPLWCNSQTIQKGRVLEKDSNWKPLENAEIFVTDAPPANSDNDGKYQLFFKDKTPGEIIFVDSINKKGYELVNESKIKNWILSDLKEFNIIFCKEGLLKESREFFYGIGKSHYEDEYNLKRSEIDALKRANLFAEEEYNQKLKDIYDERQKAYEKLDYYSDLFSRINIDDLSKLERNAFELSKQGKIDEAIQVYEREKLLTKFIRNDSLKQHTKIDLESMVPSVRRYAELCAFAGGRENYEKAGRCYEAIALSDTTNYNQILDYAYFLENQKNYSKAYSYYCTALKLSKNDIEKADVLNSLGNIQRLLNQYEAAEIYIVKSLNVRRALYLVNPNYYCSDLVSSLNNYAFLLFNMKKYKEAEKIYKQAVEFNNFIKKSNLREYLLNKALLFGNLTLLEIEIQNFDEAILYVTKTLDIYKIFDYANHRLHADELARTLINISISYSKKGDYEKAENYLSEAIDIFEELLQLNPESYKIELAIAFHNLASIEMYEKYYAKALFHFDKSLNIRKELALKNPNIYNSYVAITLFQMASLYKEIGQSKNSENAYQECIRIYSKLAKVNNNIFNSELAIAFESLGELQFKNEQYNKAEINFLEAIDLYRKLSNLDVDQYTENLAIGFGNLALVYEFTKQYEKAYISYSNSLDTYKKISDYNHKYSSKLADLLYDLAKCQKERNLLKEADKYYSDAIYTYLKISHIEPNPQIYIDCAINQLDMHSYGKAKVNFIKAAKILGELKKGNPSLRIYLVTTLTYIADIQKTTKHYKKSILYYNDALKFLKELIIEYPNEISFSEFFALTLHHKAQVYGMLKQETLAISSYCESVEIYRELAKKSSISYEIDLANILNELAWNQYKTNLDEAIKNTQDAIDIYNKIEKIDIDLINHLAVFYGRMSRYLLLIKQYKSSEEFAHKSIKNNSSFNSGYKNLAHALLYQGQFKEALKIYSNLKNDITIKKQINTDFIEFEKAGITHPDVEKIRQLLK